MRIEEILMITSEQFHPEELTSIKKGFKEFEIGQIEFVHPTIVYEELEEIWQPDMIAEKVSYCKIEPIKPKWFIGMSNEFIRTIQYVDKKLQSRILKAISYISKKPALSKGNTVTPLKGSLKGLWRYRIGSYRIVYYIDKKNSQIVLVTFSGRGNVYK